MNLGFSFGKKRDESSSSTGRFDSIFSPSKDRQPTDAPSSSVTEPHESEPVAVKPVAKSRFKSITDFTNNLGKNISEMLDLPEPTVNNNKKNKNDGTIDDGSVDIFSASLFDVVKSLSHDATKEVKKLIPTKQTAPSSGTSNSSATTPTRADNGTSSGRPRRASDFLEMENIYTLEEFDVDTPGETRRAAEESKRQRDAAAAVLINQRQYNEDGDEEHDSQKSASSSSSDNSQPHIPSDFAAEEGYESDDGDEEITDFEIKSSFTNLESPVSPSPSTPHPIYDHSSSSSPSASPSTNHHLVSHMVDDSVLESSQIDDDDDEEEDGVTEQGLDQTEMAEVVKQPPAAVSMLKQDGPNQEEVDKQWSPQKGRKNNNKNKNKNNNKSTQQNTVTSATKQRSTPLKIETEPQQDPPSSNFGFDDFDDDEFCV